MGSIRIYSQFSNITVFKDFVRYVSAWVQEATQTINGTLELVKNIKAAGPYSVLIPAAPAVIEIEHSFGAVPQGYILTWQSADSSIYVPDVANSMFSSTGGIYNWTDKKVFLTASAGVQARLYLI